MRYPTAVLVVSLLVVAAAGPQDQEIQLELRSRGGQPVQIAVPALLARAGAEAEAATLHETLWNDLDWSMAFTLVDRRVYPDVAPDEPIPWERWRRTGARGLVQGTVRREGDAVVADFRIYDVASARQVLGKRYVQQTAGLSAAEARYRLRRIAHEFNDEAVLYYTGVRGVAATRIAFVSDREAPRDTPQKEVFIMDADGERQRRITYNRSIALSPSFSPQADRLVYQTYVLRDGFPNAEIHMIFNRGGRPRVVVACRGMNNGPSFSPDGTLIAFSSSCPGNSEIHTVRPDGTDLRRLTRNPGSDVSPSWSPNGRQIVFVSDRGGSQQLYVMDATGLNTRRLFAPGGQKDDPAWQPVHGELIAYTASTGGNNFDIFVYDLTSDRVFQLTRGRGRKEAPAWSPDGRQLVFEWTRDEGTQLWAMGLDGSRLRRLTAAGNNLTPSWGNRP